MVSLTPEERKARTKVDAVRSRRRHNLFRKADEYARLAHAQVFVMVRYRCQNIGVSKTYIYHSDPEESFPWMSWQKMHTQEYPRPKVLTPGDLLNSNKKKDNAEDYGDKYGDNITSAGVFGPQVKAEHDARATVPTLSLAAASHPVASRLAANSPPHQPGSSHPAIGRPAISSYVTNPSPVDYAVIAQPIATPSFEAPAVTLQTQSHESHAPASWSFMPSPAGSLVSASYPVGLA